MRVYLLKCEHCGVPLASNVVACPYCGQANSAEALVTDKNIEVKDGHMHIKKGAHLKIGQIDDKGSRACPFCGEVGKAARQKCKSCGNTIIIKRLRVQKSLTITGSLTVGPGGSLVIGPSDNEEKLFKAINKGKLDAVKAAVYAGADVDYDDDDLGTSLFFALKNGHVDIAKFLLSMGAAAKPRKKLVQMAKELSAPELAAALTAK